MNLQNTKAKINELRKEWQALAQRYQRIWGEVFDDFENFDEIEQFTIADEDEVFWLTVDDYDDVVFDTSERGMVLNSVQAEYVQQTAQSNRTSLSAVNRYKKHVDELATLAQQISDVVKKLNALMQRYPEKV